MRNSSIQRVILGIGFNTRVENSTFTCKICANTTDAGCLCGSYMKRMLIYFAAEELGAVTQCWIQFNKNQMASLCRSKLQSQKYHLSSNLESCCGRAANESPDHQFDAGVHPAKHLVLLKTSQWRKQMNKIKLGAD